MHIAPLDVRVVAGEGRHLVRGSGQVQQSDTELVVRLGGKVGAAPPPVFVLQYPNSIQSVQFGVKLPAKRCTTWSIASIHVLWSAPLFIARLGKTWCREMYSSEPRAKQLMVLHSTQFCQWIRVGAFVGPARWLKSPSQKTIPHAPRSVGVQGCSPYVSGRWKGLPWPWCAAHREPAPEGTHIIESKGWITGSRDTLRPQCGHPTVPSDPGPERQPRLQKSSLRRRARGTTTCTWVRQNSTGLRHRGRSPGSPAAR